ncbi:S-adenosyl-L-methionine-dependent methyltransferase [Coniella lustricola]|uniref:tRNA (uracil(54)-C(5))-methyltransferase n=1 Tax=Coniella lustricola TaxID=2025994 RepID=A0A2T3A827_9PEZI|nr:S-adenosyl-L-methionine-dependent methyltransferase [Coniella lustricola]
MRHRVWNSLRPFAATPFLHHKRTWLDTCAPFRPFTMTSPPLQPVGELPISKPASEAPANPESVPTVPAKRTLPNGNGNGNNANEGPAGKKKKVKKFKPKPIKEGSSEEVLMMDIQAMLEAQKLEDAAPATDEAEELPEPGSIIDVQVQALSSTGDGLARQPGRKNIYVVKNSIPGDVVRIKVYLHIPTQHHSVGDFISVVKPSPLRDDSRIGCQYFGQCSGCQFQMMDYADQLAHKRTIVEKAFKNFSQLAPELVPTVQETMGSPLQYGYRTKLTPHFDAPPGAPFGRRSKSKPKVFHAEVPAFGFTLKGARRVMDIEDCPIGTDAVRRGMKRERERLKVDFGKYERGATILLRENTTRIPAGEAAPADSTDTTISSTASTTDPDAVVVKTDRGTDIKTYITDSNATSREYIDDFVFTNPAGSFFQNNNSILPSFTDYIRQHILPPPALAVGQKPIKYLIDAYSGSGLFTITLSSLFSGGSIGIDIAGKSIEYARTNAKLNGLDEEQCKFIAADATELFKSVSRFDPDETCVVLDPSRKGCDASFLEQLLRFAPRRVIYVSCNVHTQARDVGVLVRGEVAGMPGQEIENAAQPKPEDNLKAKTRYDIESLRGFDFFPQTSHVEGVAILNRVVEA